MKIIISYFFKHRFLFLRRISQLTILILFILGNASLITIANNTHIIFANNLTKFEDSAKNPAIAIPKDTILPHPILEGNLSFSKIFNTIPLSDPLAFMQILLSGGAITLDLILGVIIVCGIYGLFLGRGFCAFVCPMNLITDLANFLRRVFKLKNSPIIIIKKNTRYIILALSLLLSLIFGFLAWESISPISMLHRSLIFGLGSGAFGVLAVFLFDLLIMRHGFCGHLCPLGASYSLIGKFSLLRIKHNVDNCTNCHQCIQICPESQVLNIIGKKSGTIDNSECIKCGRCIEVCNDSALKFHILNLQNKERK